MADRKRTEAREDWTAAADAYLRREAKLNARIEASVTRTRDVCGGAPCIAGTRVTVEWVVECFLGGYSIAKLRRCFPHVTREQLEDALRWWFRHGAHWRKAPVRSGRAVSQGRARG